MTQITEAIDVVPNPAPPVPGIARDMENRYYTASQFQLMWWKFRKHRLALIGTALLAVFVFIALFAVKLSIGLRVTSDGEREGLDITDHGERAYNF